MKKVGFIGACDKSNLIIYVAKAITYSDKKVMIIDTTITQKTKYIVPAINPTKSYVTEFEGIDFAVGFKNIQEIKKYLGLREDIAEDKIPYDYILIDIDSSEMLESFEIQSAEMNYFVTTFDMYSLKRGVEILDGLQAPMKLAKVLYNYNITKEDEEYLDYISLDTKAVWKEFTIYLPRTNTDNEMIEENQRVYKIRLKKLSIEYQDGILYITQEILNENMNRLKKTIKE